MKSERWLLTSQEVLAETSFDSSEHFSRCQLLFPLVSISALPGTHVSIVHGLHSTELVISTIVLFLRDSHK